MDDNLDAKRLEELAEMANRWSIRQDKDGWGRVADDFRDLARCAKAWARVERAMAASANPVELMGYRGRIQHWAWYLGGPLETQGRAITAIAAVEAAPEVTDAK